MEGKPNPPTVYGHWYAGIHGALLVDHNEGQYGGGLLRHETVYQFPSGEEGRDRAAQGLFGLENMHLTEIHVQTKEMADANDPGVMLNLVHMNWTDPSNRGFTTCPEENLDWRRFPSPPLDTDSQLGKGMCVCVPDPTGLPWFEHAYDNATYKGRVEIVPPWQTTGKWGPPTNKTVIADHFAKWSFHLWVDVETQLPILFLPLTAIGVTQTSFGLKILARGGRICLPGTRALTQLVNLKLASSLLLFLPRQLQNQATAEKSSWVSSRDCSPTLMTYSPAKGTS